MSKFWVILKREYVQVVKKKSFIIGIILTPILMGGFTLIPALLVRTKASTAEKLAVIDQSGLNIGQRFGKSLERYKLDDSITNYYKINNIFEVEKDNDIRFNEINDSLRQLIIDKEIKYFLVIKPEAHLIDTNIFLVTNSDNFVTLNRFERRLSDVLSSIRLDMSEINLEVDSILNLTKRIDLKTKDAKGESIPFMIKYFSAIIFVGIMFGMIFGYGQLVMRSVIEEKNSRIMEVLISSVTPFQLMLGKVMGLGAATFTQIAVWVILGAGIYSMKGAFEIDPSIDRIIFNPVIIIFFILYMISGYILFSTLFALIGSIVNTEKEAQSFIFPITMVMILPFMIGMYIIQEPNSTLSVTLSLIPFLTPNIMIMRIIFIAPTLTEYSLASGIIGEAILGFILIVISIIGM
ncbi:MAG: ABC transporter permease, partial [Candidatus Zixiibacteriota bacterium]